MALVAVDRGCSESAGGARMREQAGEVLLAGLGEVLAIGSERVQPVPGERLVQMPAARHYVRQFRAAHESGVVTVAARDLLHRAAQENHCIRRRDAGAQRDVNSSWLGRTQSRRSAGKLQALEVVAQQLDHRFKLVVLVLGQELVAGGEEARPPAGYPTAPRPRACRRGSRMRKTWNSTSSPATNS